MVHRRGRRKKIPLKPLQQSYKLYPVTVGVPNLPKQNIPIRQTLEIYRSAVRYLVEVYESVWEELAQIEESKKRFNAAEHLVHTTKRNPARFDFDFCFPKMPSYFRRAAVQHALGSVSSYRTRLEQWKAEGQKTGKPYLKSEQYAMPVFYHDVMYRENTEEKDAAFLKLYDGHDWKWFAVRLKHTDMELFKKIFVVLFLQRWRRSFFARPVFS